MVMLNEYLEIVQESELLAEAIFSDKFRNSISKVTGSFKTKDPKKIQSALKVLPKKDPSKIDKEMKDKIKNYDGIKSSAMGPLNKSDIPDKTKKALSSIFAINAAMTPNPKETAKKSAEDFVAKFNGEDYTTMGMGLAVITAMVAGSWIVIKVGMNFITKTMNRLTSGGKAQTADDLIKQIKSLKGADLTKVLQSLKNTLTKYKGSIMIVALIIAIIYLIRWVSDE